MTGETTSHAQPRAFHKHAGPWCSPPNVKRPPLPPPRWKPSAALTGIRLRVCSAFRSFISHAAQDLTQEFFCRFLEKRWLDTADREKGRLRTFLIVVLKKFMVVRR
jgi:hypothetical protein